ncbi:hypothetical protein SSS_07271 [Sarcoptes scabiei]|uniref:Uncharacterized protein n=1 Tax=Sarcoptes scabiei TaxID=52283 RepID=A0A834R6U3_SARSC|nr:hypothetical protein SSS_07271 [Sarcoptes scabiei]
MNNPQDLDEDEADILSSVNEDEENSQRRSPKVFSAPPTLRSQPTPTTIKMNPLALSQMMRPKVIATNERKLNERRTITPRRRVVGDQRTNQQTNRRSGVPNPAYRTRTRPIEQRLARKTKDYSGRQKKLTKEMIGNDGGGKQRETIKSKSSERLIDSKQSDYQNESNRNYRFPFDDGATKEIGEEKTVAKKSIKSNPLRRDQIKMKQQQPQMQFVSKSKIFSIQSKQIEIPIEFKEFDKRKIEPKLITKNDDNDNDDADDRIVDDQIDQFVSAQTEKISTLKLQSKNDPSSSPSPSSSSSSAEQLVSTRPTINQKMKLRKEYPILLTERISSVEFERFYSEVKYLEIQILSINY